MMGEYKGQVAYSHFKAFVPVAYHGISIKERERLRRDYKVLLS